MDDEKWKIVGYVISSTYRERTLKILMRESNTPTAIADEANIKINHISKVLGELKSKGLIECINESKRKNRIYRITALGREIARKLD